MSGVRLQYDGVGVGSNKSFSVNTHSVKEDFAKPNEILDRELVFQNYGNPCDLYSVGLDGSVLPLPENAANTAVGFWSASQSSHNGMLTNNVRLSMSADEYFSSAGITLKFDTNKGIFPTSLMVEWYRDDEVVSFVYFYPESAEVFISKRVDLYNRVDISFYSLNVPHNRLVLQSVEFGLVTEFNSRVLKSSAIKQSISTISDILPINTLNFTLVNKEGIDFVFQEKQPIEAYFDDKLKGVFFVKKATQNGINSYTVSCEDYIGLLEDATFYGGVYEEYNVAHLIRSICNVAGVPVIVPAELEGQYIITGHVPIGTCRSALQQVLFALQAHADTSDARGLHIKSSLSGSRLEIPRSRIMQGINISSSSNVTAVEIVAHSYTPSDEEVVLFDAKENGYGDNIEVVFSEPFHSLRLEDGHFVEHSSNHAIINATESSVLRGKKYIHNTVVKRKQNDLIVATAKKNVKRIENATLVNLSNVDNILYSCYNYLVNNQEISARIVEGKHESNGGYVYDTPVKLGDLLELETAFKGNVFGVLESQKYSMNGGILVKECVLR